jgi:hypothetical protein
MFFLITARRKESLIFFTTKTLILSRQSLGFKEGNSFSPNPMERAAWPQSTEVSGQNLRLRSTQLRGAMLPRNAGHCWAIWGIVTLTLRYINHISTVMSQ